MSRRIAFLRAVNLGRRRVNMAQLAQLVSGLGYADVWTHINSGNVVFDATGSRAQVERTIETALEDALGFEVTTFVRSTWAREPVASNTTFPLLMCVQTSA